MSIHELMTKITGGSNAAMQAIIPPLDDSTIAMIAKMGFSKGKGGRNPKECTRQSG